MAGTLFGLKLIADLHPPVARLRRRVEGWLGEFDEFDLIGGAVGANIAGVDVPVRFAGDDTGLAHGAAGVLLVAPQRELVDWLLARSDGWGRQRRQAWCYGTPGIAAALWAAGARDEAVTAMRSLCHAYDPEIHLYGRDADVLGLCHGAAGVMLIADAFDHLDEAAALRDRLRAFLLARFDRVLRLDNRFLTGAPGVLAALLAVDGGNRDWLPCLGLSA